VQRATMSLDASGRMHNHQSRVPRAVKEAYLANLLDHYDKSLKRALYDKDFDALHDVCEGAVVPGVGPVFLYDVATRIGAWGNVHPTSLYLHAGVRQGWEALMVATTDQTFGYVHSNYARRIRIAAPKLREVGLCPPLTADEAEDFLCTYRSQFHTLAVARG
jgi:hypothetical protein